MTNTITNLFKKRESAVKLLNYKSNLNYTFTIFKKGLIFLGSIERKETYKIIFY